MPHSDTQITSRYRNLVILLLILIGGLETTQKEARLILRVLILVSEIEVITTSKANKACPGGRNRAGVGPSLPIIALEVLETAKEKARVKLRTLLRVTEIKFAAASEAHETRPRRQTRVGVRVGVIPFVVCVVEVLEAAGDETRFQLGELFIIAKIELVAAGQSYET